MFGTYSIPATIEKEGIRIEIKKENGHLVYARSCSGETLEKIVLTDSGTILINPVEPLNKPKELTPYFLIEFATPLSVEPRSTHRVHVTFPVEAGVFIRKKDEFENIDILTKAKQKYTLYGDMQSGILCRYWKSAVYPSAPSVNPLLEGVMALIITNASGSWAELKKAVFNAFGMKIYYSAAMVTMAATLKITGSAAAETDFADAPAAEGMLKSLELYTARKLLVLSSKFSMSEGI